MARTKATLYFRNGILHCGICDRKMSDRTHNRQACLAEPSPGVGYPRASDIPIKTTVGFSSELNGRMVRYLDRSTDPRHRALKAMHVRYPAYADVFWRHKVKGESLADIAARLGISTSNAKKRSQRANHFYRTRVILYSDLDERDYRNSPDDELPHSIEALVDATEDIGHVA